MYFIFLKFHIFLSKHIAIIVAKKVLNIVEIANNKKKYFWNVTIKTTVSIIYDAFWTILISEYFFVL